MTALAEERYETQKDKYALVPETRLASHILLLCTPGVCDRDARRIEAEKILAELEAGADFGELAKTYSEDRASKDMGGRFDRWVKLGEAQVDPHFVGAMYEIGNVGDHSGIVDTRFGLHIIQLDGIEEAHYKPYAEVQDQIIATLRKEYIDLAAKEFDAGFRFTDDTYIDTETVEEILAPYKTAQ
jgi:parvulin-like peptidyl-prolyl isomerase